MTADDILGVERNFASLSTRDLLEARDLYHWHLIHKVNVVGTAIGLYRIRNDDPWPDENRQIAHQTRAAEGRTAEAGAHVRELRDPRLLLALRPRLGRHWQKPTDFARRGTLAADQAIPKTLYMPDGRMVPVCVVKVTRSAPDPRRIPGLAVAEGRDRRRFPARQQTQGSDRVASVGSLVTDGHTVYALHEPARGRPDGSSVSAIREGRRSRSGAPTGGSSPGSPSPTSTSTSRADERSSPSTPGLVEVTDVDEWTSQTYGSAHRRDLADLSERNIGMRLINAEVRAFGAASGQLHGRIAALFYRHRSIGGYDDITDFLIAPEPGSAQSQPGDSGTVWHLVQRDGLPLRPIAVQWGGQGFSTRTAQSSTSPSRRA